MRRYLSIPYLGGEFPPVFAGEHADSLDAHARGAPLSERAHGGDGDVAHSLFEPVEDKGLPLSLRLIAEIEVGEIGLHDAVRKREFVVVRALGAGEGDRCPLLRQPPLSLSLTEDGGGTLPLCGMLRGRTMRGKDDALVCELLSAREHIIAQDGDAVIRKIEDTSHWRGMREGGDAAVRPALLHLDIGERLGAERGETPLPKCARVEERIVRVPGKVDHLRMLVKETRKAVIPPSRAAVDGAAGGVVGGDEDGTVTVRLRDPELLRDPAPHLLIAVVHPAPVGGRADEMPAVDDVMREGAHTELALEEPPRSEVSIVVVIAHYRLNNGFIITEHGVKTPFERFVAVFGSAVADVSRKDDEGALLLFQGAAGGEQIALKRGRLIVPERGQLRVGNDTDPQPTRDNDLFYVRDDLHILGAPYSASFSAPSGDAPSAGTASA